MKPVSSISIVAGAGACLKPGREGGGRGALCGGVQPRAVQQHDEHVQGGQDRDQHQAQT